MIFCFSFNSPRNSVYLCASIFPAPNINTTSIKMRPFVPRCAFAGSSQISRSLLQRSWQTGRRFYSIQPEAASKAVPQDVDVSKLVVEQTKTPSPLKKSEELIFGQTFSGMPSLSSLMLLWSAIQLTNPPPQITCSPLSGTRPPVGTRRKSNPTRTCPSTRPPASSTTPLNVSRA